MSAPRDFKSEKPAPASTLSSGVQTFASFLIFLQLFAIVVGVLSNESPSSLEANLRRVVRPYIELMNMDLSYAYTLTYGPTTGPGLDAQVEVEVELDLPDGKKETIVLPASNLISRQRMRRYQLLAAQSVARLEGNATLESVVPQAIAQRLVTETGATGGTIRCRWKQLPTEAFRTTGEQQNTAYEARILVADGQVELLKREAASEAAPKAGKR
jgi:hypothetical protein